jgi:hypothetical protein
MQRLCAPVQFYMFQCHLGHFQGALHQDLNFKQTVNKPAANSHRILWKPENCVINLWTFCLSPILIVTQTGNTLIHTHTHTHTHESAITSFHLQHNSSAKLTSCIYEHSKRPAAIINSPWHALYTIHVYCHLTLFTENLYSWSTKYLLFLFRNSWNWYFK